MEHSLTHSWFQIRYFGSFALAARRYAQRTSFAFCNSFSRVIDRLVDLPKLDPIFKKIAAKSNQDTTQYLDQIDVKSSPFHKNFIWIGSLIFASTRTIRKSTSWYNKFYGGRPHVTCEDVSRSWKLKKIRWKPLFYLDVLLNWCCCSKLRRFSDQTKIVRSTWIENRGLIELNWIILPCFAPCRARFV